MVTRAEVLKGRDCPPELEANLEDLLNKINILRGVYSKPFIINSGYRPADYNKQIGGAPNSAHIHCQAVDIRDLRGELGQWCLQNQAILEEVGLWLEDPMYTKQWVHLQTRPANNRVFQP